MGGNNAQVTTEEDLKSEIPLGEQREVFTEDPHTDYSNFDKHMEERINNMRQGNSFSHNNTQNVNEQNGSDRHAKLEKRVAILEKALELVMATQTKMIKEGKKT